MPQLNRQYCTRCGESVYNCMIDGKRVPLVLYFVVGQPADTGEPIDVNAVPVPSFIREIMQTEPARVELCVKCVAEVFGVPCLEAKDDPMYDANNDRIPDALQLQDPKLGAVERAQRSHYRVLHAIKVGRGEATAADLPPEYQAPAPALTTGDMTAVRRLLATMPAARREAALKELSEVGGLTLGPGEVLPPPTT